MPSRGRSAAHALRAGIANRDLNSTAALLAGLGWSAALIGPAWPLRPFDAAIWLPLQGAGIAFQLCGVALWRRHPGNRTGLLMWLMGVTWYLGTLQLFDHPALFAVGFCTFYTDGAVLGHLVLALPDGRLGTRARRVAATAGYLTGPGTQIPRYLVEGNPAAQVWGHTDHAASVWADLGSIGALAVTAVHATLVVRRWRTAGPPSRRQYGTVWAMLLVTGVCTATIAALCLFDLPLPVRGQGFLALALALLATPVAVIVGLVRTRLGRMRVADLVEELERAEHPRAVRDALARALDDPTLEVYYWLPDCHGYADDLGHPVELPATASRSHTVVESDGEPLAVLLHDPALVQQTVLVAPVAAAARLALRNAHLHTSARAEVGRIQDSRRRLVMAADAERRRIQRDLHDGAQHRLLAVAMLLARVEGQAPMLRGARDELLEALRELRAITEGIHPPALAEQGLCAAVERLAERAPLPVTVALPPHRWTPLVERTAYYVIAEALTNVFRHAEATRVRVGGSDGAGRLLVWVDDDGNGTARPRPGGGLQGLQDRAHAAGGRLSVRSVPGSGTRIELELPCGP